MIKLRIVIIISLLLNLILFIIISSYSYKYRFVKLFNVIILSQAHTKFHEILRKTVVVSSTIHSLKFYVNMHYSNLMITYEFIPKSSMRSMTVSRFYKCQRQAFVTIEHLFQTLQRCPSNRYNPAEARP